jgi:hypothetical protein
MKESKPGLNSPNTPLYGTAATQLLSHTLCNDQQYLLEVLRCLIGLAFDTPAFCLYFLRAQGILFRKGAAA